MRRQPGNPADYESFLVWEALVSILSYDPGTGEFRWRSSRHNRVKIGQVAGTVHGGYRRIEILKRSFYASRLAWFYMTKKWPSSLIDHKDGDSTNDRWDNLREATRTQNGRNRKISKNNTSGVIGVYWHKQLGKWAARATIDGRRQHIGFFDTLEEATAVRQRAEREHFGDFVRSA